MLCHLGLHLTDVAVHGHNPPIIHGDLKGVSVTCVYADILLNLQSNVLVSDDGVARLSDFGFSTLVVAAGGAEDTDLKCAHPAVSPDAAVLSNFPPSISLVKGTLNWMAPELFASDAARHTIASDIWACGCIMLEVRRPRRVRNNVVTP